MSDPAGGTINEDGRQILQVFVRFGALALWALWCFRIIDPFITFLVWGVLLAVAIHPLHLATTRLLGGRPKLSATLITLGQLLIIVGPVVVFGTVIVENLRELSGHLFEGTLKVPPPPPGVESWPVVGQPLSELWSLASDNIDAALARFRPELRSIGAWTLEAAAGAGLGIAEFAAAIVAAGVMLLHGPGGKAAARGLARGLVGPERGDALADLAGATVRSVARGVLGVALIQALMAGVGMLVAGVPLAGLWALVALICAVVQLGVGPVLIPAVIWSFSTQSTLAASLFLAWSIVCMLIDNVLKPLLLGRGVAVPMPVVFLGAIGGMLRSGIIGLFVGAVILSLGYKVLVDWMGLGRGQEEPESPAEAVG